MKKQKISDLLKDSYNKTKILECDIKITKYALKLGKKDKEALI